MAADSYEIVALFRPPLGIRWLYVVGMWVSLDGGPWLWEWNVRNTLAVLRSALTNGGR